MSDSDLALAVMDDDGWGCAITTAPAPPLIQYGEDGWPVASTRIRVNGQVVRLYARQDAPAVTCKQTGEQGIVMAEEEAGYWAVPIPGTAAGWTVSHARIPAFWPRVLTVTTEEGAS